MNEYEPIFTRRMKNAPIESLNIVADIMMDAILKSDLPKEAKIEVEIMRAFKDMVDALHAASIGFDCHIPPTEEGKAVQARIYPARKEFLEYLQLMKTGLDSFLAANPVPDIPPEFRRASQQARDRL